MKKQYKDLLKLTWPIFIENIMFMLLAFIDTWMLSNYSDSAASAVGATTQVIWMFTLVFTIISGSSAVLTAQSLGKKERTLTSKIAAVSMLLSLIIGIVSSIILIQFREPILNGIGVTKELFTYSNDYLLYVGGAIFLQALLSNVSSIIRSHGYTKITMKVTLFMNTINAILDAVFIFGFFGFPILGVKGVAIATSFSRLIGLVILCIFFFRTIERINIFKLISPIPFDIIKDMILLGVPSALEKINYNAAQLFMTAIILNNIGENAFTTKTYVMTLVRFFFAISLAIGQANQIMISRYKGEKNYELADKNFSFSLKTALIATLSLSVLGSLFGKQLITIFTDNQYIITLGATILILDIIVEIGRTFNVVVIDALRGTGDTIFPVIIGILSLWLISTGLAYFLGVTCNFGLIGIWIAFGIDECLRGILMYFRWKSGKWKNKSLSSM
ncbi:MATE family efflux transporter [Oceanirhabdus sp. W0125-5]|uniref:MATE family efflux transporter n=1 Tax=Oceanirhabdus sp. W0125-5 TaxID=2999116 RepID=UPI0022F30936|nr:MATE family efflux transporter [Oceanirhabdus sp. W0125-5]WBW94727.1 MATE family efflux transporter [Oceanirhabdus sp. W0125-5]